VDADADVDRRLDMFAVKTTYHPSASRIVATRVVGTTRGRRQPSCVTRASSSSSFFDDVLARVLPKEVNEARKEMAFFDGPTGMLRGVLPEAITGAKPTVRAPEVGAGDDVVFDFGTMSRGMFDETFCALNDVVMGGGSDATATLDNGAMRLAGTTEDQRGGFASVKSRDFERALDLRGYEGVKLTCRGDGKRYKMILYDTNDSFNVAFHQEFDCPKETNGGEVLLKFSDFVPVRRGRAVAKDDPEYRLTAGQKIVAVQFMLSKFAYGMEEKNAGYAPGPFFIEITRVEAFK
jgi:hypothetical protein